MNEIFVKLVNMSIAAGWLIIAVLVLRLLLKKAPRWITCLLWAFVAIRLICPFSVQSQLSAYQVAAPAAVQEDGRVEYFQYVHGSGDKPSIMLDMDSIGLPAAGHTQQGDPVISVGPLEVGRVGSNPTRFLPPLLTIWAAVGSALLLYGLISALRLRFRVREAMHLRENIWLCDTVTSPFLLGIVRPRIYLPSGMEEGQMNYVLAHEHAHLRRLDHIWKPLGYLLLAVHWFNPLVWLAYWLFCRDIETACDQRVVRGWNTEDRKAYSAALLACSQGRRMVLVCPVAFGEVGVKARIKAVLNDKKPAFWVVLAAVLVCAAVAVCFLTDPLAAVRSGPAGTLTAVEKENVISDYRADFAADLSGAALDMAIYADVWSGDSHTATRRLTASPYVGEVSLMLTEGSGANLLWLQVNTDEYGAYDSVTLGQPEALRGAPIRSVFSTYTNGETLTVREGDEVVLAALALDYGSGLPDFDCHALSKQLEIAEATPVRVGQTKLAQQADYMLVIRAVFTASTAQPAQRETLDVNSGHVLLRSHFKWPMDVTLDNVAENKNGVTEDFDAFVEQQKWEMETGAIMPTGAEKRIVLHSQNGMELYIESGVNYMLWHHPDAPEQNIAYSCGLTGEQMIELLSAWAWDTKQGIARSKETVPDASAFFERFPNGNFRWDIYQQFSPDSQDGSDRIMALLDELQAYVESDGLTVDQYRTLLRNTAGLDGAYAEGYEYLLEQAYQRDPEAYMQAWRSLTFQQQKSVPSGIAGVLPRPAVIRWSYDSDAINYPYVLVNGGGKLLYMELPDDLARRLQQRLAANEKLGGFEHPQFTNDWGRHLISWTAEMAEVFVNFSDDYRQHCRLVRGDAHTWGLSTDTGTIKADSEVRELLAMISALTGWQTENGREAFSGLTAAELIYNGKTLHTVIDTDRLAQLQNLLQNATQASFASKTPMERVQLRMTRSDGSTVSVLLDTDTPRIFLPPFYYYEYNDYESTETLPLLEALGLTAWPAETEDMNCNPWLTELMEEFVPLPTAPVSAADGVFPLVEDVVNDALRKIGLPVAVFEDETQFSGENGENGVTYTLRNSGEGLYPWGCVNSAVYGGNKRFLQVTYLEALEEDAAFRWTDWKQPITLAGLLYGGYADEEELYRLLSQLEIPENTAADGAQWLLDTKGGFCRVIYSINKAQDKIFSAGINVTLYDSEADYREMMKQSQQNRETNRREQLASMAQ